MCVYFCYHFKMDYFYIFFFRKILRHVMCAVCYSVFICVSDKNKREWLLIDSKIQIDMTLFKINPPKGMDTQFDYIVVYMTTSTYTYIHTHTHTWKKQFIYKPNKQGIRYWPRKKDMFVSVCNHVPIHAYMVWY